MVSEKITNVSNNTYIVIQYLYDINNSLYGFIYNNQTYYYIKNMLGIIIHIIDSNGNTVVNYDYDVYGDIISISGSMASTINNINHYVYKSYYMDYENNLYYLKTRYYNPSIGRFISSDNIEYLDANTVSGLNLYAYCVNDPVNHSDPEGTVALGSILAIVMLAGVFLANPAATIIGAIGATVCDIAAISSINNETDIAVTDDNVSLKNSSKIHTSWMRYGYSVYLNYFYKKTRDKIQGTSIGFEFE